MDNNYFDSEQLYRGRYDIITLCEFIDYQI